LNYRVLDNTTNLEVTKYCNLHEVIYNLAS